MATRAFRREAAAQPREAGRPALRARRRRLVEMLTTEENRLLRTREVARESIQARGTSPTSMQSDTDQPCDENLLRAVDIEDGCRPDPPISSLSVVPGPASLLNRHYGACQSRA